MDDLCFKSKNLYNYVNYLIREEYIKNKKFLSEYKMVGELAKENQTDFRSLPAQTSCQIIKVIFKNWKSYFKAIRDWSKNAHKYKIKPNFPGYKHKINGRNIVIFTGQNKGRLKDGYINFPKMVNLLKIKTKTNNVKQVIIVPQQSCFVVEIIYKREAKKVKDLKKKLYVGLDMGVNNLTTLVTNSVDIEPMLVNGRIIKSMNQFYNQKQALLQGFIKRGTSNRLKLLVFKRNKKVDDYLHKASRLIINYCIKYKIGNIVIGKNDNWKQGLNMRKVNNQNFAYIPHARFIKMIQYKAEEVGINVILTEESYTSKCDALALEPLKHQEHYLGSRVERGLFKSSIDKYINADINGALNILRKVIGDRFIKPLIDRGIADMPIRMLNPYKYTLQNV
jgi:putative transposase